MSAFCRNCGEFDWGSSHKCPHMWEVYCPGYGQDADDARCVHAADAEAAAEKWAERSDTESAEYSIVRGEVAECFVRRVGTDEWAKFAVSGESVPHYSARLLDAKEKPHA